MSVGRALKPAAFLLAAVVLLYLPQGFEKLWVERFTVTITIALAALGLNLLTGYNGQISLGHSAFFGIGAYTTVILVVDHGWPYLGTTVAAAAIAFVVGMGVGLPALRIKGLYLALTTLALGTMFPQIVKRFDDVTGGTQGRRIPRTMEWEAPAWTGLADDQWTYYVCLAIAVVCFVGVRNLVRSRVGRALVAMRDNEIAAEVAGVHLARYKVLTFGVSASLAGIAGSLSVLNDPFVAAGRYEVAKSIEFLLAVVIGGAASITGPVWGALFVKFAPQVIEDLEFNEALTPVIFGSLLIVGMRLMPSGLVGFARRVSTNLRRSHPPPAELPAEPDRS